MRDQKHSKSACNPTTAAEDGFSLLELVMVVLISIILTAAAIPTVQAGLYRYRLESAVATATWAIQSTRYQSLMEGYPYEVAMSTSTEEYQIEDEPSGTTSFANVGTPVPLSGSNVSLNQNTTLEFKPDGSVSAPVGSLSFTITYQGYCQTVTVSNYANITLSTIGQSCS